MHQLVTAGCVSYTLKNPYPAQPQLCDLSGARQVISQLQHFYLAFFGILGELAINHPKDWAMAARGQAPVPTAGTVSCWYESALQQAGKGLVLITPQQAGIALLRRVTNAGYRAGGLEYQVV